MTDPSHHQPDRRPSHAERHVFDSLVSTAAVLHRAADELATQFNGIYATQTIYACLTECYDLLDRHATVKTHLPVLATRFAHSRLTAAAQATGALMSHVPEVLFVCVHNAGRSQMAAALLHHHAAGKVHVRSAGSAPADSINPAVIAVMDELGLDLSTEFPKPLTDDVVKAADVVITMGCGDACPLYPGKRYLDWDLDDPAGKTPEQVRPIRDEIDTRVRQLLTELIPATT